MTATQIANLLAGAILGVVGAMLDSGVDQDQVEQGLQDALNQMTAIPASELATNAAEWAKLATLIGKAQA